MSSEHVASDRDQSEPQTRPIRRLRVVPNPVAAQMSAHGSTSVPADPGPADPGPADPAPTVVGPVAIVEPPVADETAPAVADGGPPAESRGGRHRKPEPAEPELLLAADDEQPSIPAHSTERHAASIPSPAGPGTGRFARPTIPDPTEDRDADEAPDRTPAGSFSLAGSWFAEA